MILELKLENWSLYHCDNCQLTDIGSSDEACPQEVHDHEYPSLGL